MKMQFAFEINIRKFRLRINIDLCSKLENVIQSNFFFTVSDQKNLWEDGVCKLKKGGMHQIIFCLDRRFFNYIIWMYYWFLNFLGVFRIFFFKIKEICLAVWLFVKLEFQKIKALVTEVNVSEGFNVKNELYSALETHLIRSML